jgi:hypothetical protein
MRIIGNAGKAREVQAVASGALSTGDTVIVNADGTVSVIAVDSATQNLSSQQDFSANRVRSPMGASYDTNSQKVVVAYRLNSDDYGYAIVGTVSGTSISFGTPVVFNSANTQQITITYDANAQRHVIAYRNEGNSSRGTVIVGTVSGASISFGTPVVFDSAGYSDFYSSTYDSNAQKVILVFRDAGGTNRGYAYVCTVSGTNISLGSVGTYTTNSTRYMSATFDSSSNKVVIAYNDNGNSQKGTAVVGTVSGTSISFGTPVVFEEGLTVYIGATFDSTLNKIVIAYTDEGNSNRGTAIVGTVSGTAISFGSSSVFATGNTTEVNIGYDPTAQKTIITYTNDTLSNIGSLVPTTISGTSLTFETTVTFDSGEVGASGIAFDSTTNQSVIAYVKEDTNKGATKLFRNAYSIPNLTSDNYIGTAATGAPDGQGAKINIKGAVDENQSGLTAGQSYYVQTDGTLSTTAGDPSVFAGTAVAATKLIVKG